MVRDLGLRESDMPSDYAELARDGLLRKAEIWAEAVAAYLYPDYSEFRNYKDSEHAFDPSSGLWHFVRDRFIEAGE